MDEYLGHLAEEYLAGRVGRRTFIRWAATLGLSAPAISAMLAACAPASPTGPTSAPTSAGASAPAAAADAGGWPATARRNDPRHRLAGGRDQPAQADLQRRHHHRLPVSELPRASQRRRCAAAGAGHFVDAVSRHQDLDVQAAPGRQVPRWQRLRRRRRGRYLQATGGQEHRLDRRQHAEFPAARRHREGRRLDGRVSTCPARRRTFRTSRTSTRQASCQPTGPATGRPARLAPARSR